MSVLVLYLFSASPEINKTKTDIAARQRQTERNVDGYSTVTLTIDLPRGLTPSINYLGGKREWKVRKSND
jgi:hypothetical protein